MKDIPSSPMESAVFDEKQESKKSQHDEQRSSRATIHDPDEAIDRLAALCRLAGRLLSPAELDRQGGEATAIRESLWLREIRWAEVQRRLLARHPDLLKHAGRVTRDGRIMKSRNETIVLDAIMELHPTPSIETYVRLGNIASYETDMVINDRVLIEVTLVPEDTTSDDWMRQKYRERIGWKVRFYKRVVGRMPVIFWAEDIGDPDRLARRVAEVEEVLRASPPPLRGPISQCGTRT